MPMSSPVGPMRVRNSALCPAQPTVQSTMVMPVRGWSTCRTSSSKTGRCSPAGVLRDFLKRRMVWSVIQPNSRARFADRRLIIDKRQFFCSNTHYSSPQLFEVAHTRRYPMVRRLYLAHSFLDSHPDGLLHDIAIAEWFQNKITEF